MHRDYACTFITRHHGKGRFGQLMGGRQVRCPSNNFMVLVTKYQIIPSKHFQLGLSFNEHHLNLAWTSRVAHQTYSVQMSQELATFASHLHKMKQHLMKNEISKTDKLVHSCLHCNCHYIFNLFVSKKHMNGISSPCYLLRTKMSAMVFRKTK